MLQSSKISTKSRQTHFLFQSLPLSAASLLHPDVVASALRDILRAFSGVTFTHADGAALLVLAVAVAAVLVAGERGTLDAAAHLAAVFVPPEDQKRRIKPQINEGNP